MKKILPRKSLKLARSPQAGFTLVELVMVITLLSILAYLGIAQMGDMSAYSLDGGAQKVLADLRYAQTKSMESGSSYGFRVTGATTYEVYKVSDGTNPTSPYTGQPMQEDLSSTFKGTEFESAVFPTAEIIFDSTGAPSTGGGTTIVMSNGEQAKQQIAVSETSGYIAIESVPEDDPANP